MRGVRFDALTASASAIGLATAINYGRASPDDQRYKSFQIF